jgi:D-beta-D-heptose 7-phosphate kinase/D-beta-D-heptose 1-phosphate adenosyltransferase
VVAPPRVLVVGDVMFDRARRFATARTCPESGVPILVGPANPPAESPGGAAHVAVAVADLGSPVTLLGLIGADPAGLRLYGMLGGRGVDARLVVDDDRPTTVKERIWVAGRLTCRLDTEATREATGVVADRLVDRSISLIATGRFGAVALADHGKGVLALPVLAAVLDAARRAGVPVLVDPTASADPGRYVGAAMIKPNAREAAQLTGTADSVRAAGRLVEAGYPAVLVTLGAAGMVLAEPGRAPVTIPVVPVQAGVDCTGAGDRAFAALAVGAARGRTWREAAEWAAGVVGEWLGGERGGESRPVGQEDSCPIPGVQNRIGVRH